jgi:hypothetical protein
MSIVLVGSYMVYVLVAKLGAVGAVTDASMQ